MSFNEKLQHLRKSNKLSQEQLADMLDVTRQSVSKWESGTTYPEMDKLITMCKIFKCSLDDLTNDEISKIDVEKKNSKDNFIGNMVSSIVDIVDKSIKMFRSMNARKIIGVLVSLFILGCFLLLLRIPFEYLEVGFKNIMINIPSKSVSGSIVGLFNLVFDTVFFTLYILAFVYIYKMAYLDKYSFDEVEIEPVEKRIITDKIDDSVSKEVKNEVKIVRESKKNENTLFCFLGNIVIWFFRILLGLCLLPFIFTLVMLFAALVIKIKLMFDGVVFIGVLLGISFAIILNLWLLEIGSVFIFNKHSSFKRLLWTFFIGLAGVGISIGLTAMEVSTMNYVEDIPQDFVKDTLKEEYSMSDSLTIDEAMYYYREIEYTEDETLTDKVTLEIEHYETLNTPIVKNDEGIITINVYFEDTFGKGKKMWELLKDDLAKKQVRDYDKLHRVVIKITSSSKNLAKIKENSKKYLEEQYKKGHGSYIYEVETTIGNYERQIDSLIEENENLKAKIEELEEYKERVKDVLE